MMRLITFILLFILPLRVFSQEKTVAADYPQDYFRNPLDIPIFLAGNFGECRPGHFHSGVDIKTLGEENQPVHAAADGYISRIKMDKGGFGHALYVIHPNGYTTLYAHLNKFAPAIQEYLDKEQYAKKHWDVDIQIDPSQFPVKKGQLIAYSGNTGASTAPHLHFEIRNTLTEHPLNPELFGLPIIDKTPPLPAEVVIYRKNTSGEGFYENNRMFIPLEKSGAVFQPDKSTSVFQLGKPVKDGDIKINNDTLIFSVIGDIGIGVNVDDHMEGSDNTIAFYTAELYLDGKLQSQITLDDIGYDESRYINAYADYKVKQQQSKWVQCFFKLPGNHLDHIYGSLNSNNGWFPCCALSLDKSESALHKIEIIITDDKKNQSRIVFYTKHSGPDLLSVTGWQQAGYKPVEFQVNHLNHYSDSNIIFTLDGNALYDNIALQTKTTKYADGYSDKYRVHYPYVPVHHYFDLKIKPSKEIPDALKSKLIMMYSDDKDEDGRAATQTDNGWYQAKVRNFGTYWLDIDTTPPVIKPQQKNGSNLGKAKQITFEIKDDKTSVKNFSGYLDGKWLCFEQHGDLFFYKFDNHCPKGKHSLVFKAEDENGNARTNKLAFTR
jgi:murein DD-endopeptidase MepM/ murein hydrolase activator NlpD